MGILEFFNQGWIGSIIGLTGILLGYLFYRFSRAKNELSLQSRSIRLIGIRRSLSMDVDILYKGISVPQLTKTNLVFWNSGTSTINGNDNVNDDKLRLEFSEGVQILRTDIIKESRKVNKFSVQSDSITPHVVNIDFDFLDPGDGVVIELLHTDQNRYPLIRGTIKGMPQGIIDRGKMLTTKEKGTTLSIGKFNVRINQWALMLIMVFMCFAAISLGLLKEGSSTSEKIFFIAVGIVYGLLFGGYSWLFSKRSYPKKMRVDEL